MSDDYIPWWIPAEHPLRTGPAAPEPEPKAPRKAAKDDAPAARGKA